MSEEQRLDGAKNLDPALVSGPLLLNLDGTSDTAITIGCAGSWHTFTRLMLVAEPVPEDHDTLEVVVSGARGGHSGGDIARGRINAIKALGRVLSRGYDAAPFRLARLEGGMSRNALPRDARATIAVPNGEVERLREAAEREVASIREQHARSDGGLECAVIGDKLPGVEMISLGPEIVGPHAPGERLSIPAAQRFYRVLGALLDDLSG